METRTVITSRLLYYARPYHLRHGQLCPGEAFPFVCARDAEEGGRILAKMADGVAVFQQMADPEADIYEEPELLALFGCVTRDHLVASAA